MRESGAARTKHGAVQALQQLAGDVDGHVRPRLEVRADDADRNAPLGHVEPVRKPPGVDLALERRQRCELAQLRLDRLEARRVETQAVERTGVERGVRRGDVRLVGREDRSRRGCERARQLERAPR